MGQRLVARILDVIVVGLGYAILAGIFAAITAVVVGSNRTDDGSGAAAGIAGFIGAMFLISLLADLYEVIMITLLGRTVGKLVMGIKVVRQSDGTKPNLGNAILRFVTPGLASLIPFVGTFGALLVFVSPAFDGSGRRQGWHDKLGGTLVIVER